MSFRSLFALAVAFKAIDNVLADDYSMCRDEKCGDCPVTLADLGTGYPECIIYNTEDVFGGLDFPPSDIEEFTAYFDVPQQSDSPECHIIVKSPASRGRTACGLVRNTFHRASCGKLNLDTTFMVQFCCGYCDCGAAGVAGVPACKPEESNILTAGGGGSSGALRLKRNGTLITPAYEGPADHVAESTITSRTENAPPQHARGFLTDRQKKKGICSGDWTPGPNPGDEDYTRPADGGTIVRTGVDGGEKGSQVQISTARTQSWTTTIEMSLGIADVLSLALSFSNTFEKSLTESATITFTVPPGESGYVIFTAYLRCSVGKHVLPVYLNDYQVNKI
ncbi:hypothetical protein PG987_016654 [Apiospora arundinis]